MTTTTAPEAEARQSVPLADRLAPSLPAIFFIVLPVLTLAFLEHHLVNADGDLPRHLRHGLYMLQNHTLIWRDPFSFTRPNQPFVPFEYGSQLIYALVYSKSGLAGVAIFASCLIAAVYAMLARFLLRRGVDPLLTLLTVSAAVLLGFPHWLARPHLISWVAIVITLTMIERDRHPPLWAYVPLFAIWANLHGGWLYGIALLGIYLVGSLAEYRYFGRDLEARAAARHFALAIPVACLATLATPMGAKLWAHLFAHLRDSYVLDHTAEFASPNFHTFLSKVTLLILLTAVTAAIVSRRRIHPARLLLLLAGIWWALTAQRNVALFGISGLTVVALHLDPEWRRLPNEWLGRCRAGFALGATRGNTGAWIVLVCCVLGLLAGGRGAIFGWKAVGNEFDARTFPVAAVRYARAEHLEGRLFADLTWGGYLLYAWPGQKVFIDGGTDFYGAEVMRDYAEVTTLQQGWRHILERRRVDAVLTTTDSKLAHELVRTPGWSLWYCDSLAAIVRRNPASSESTPAVLEHELGECDRRSPYGR